MTDRHVQHPASPKSSTHPPNLPEPGGLCSSAIPGVEDALQTLFGLTPDEARAARLLAEGFSIEAAAAAMHVAPATACSILLRAYRKTATGRPAAMAKLMGQIYTGYLNGPPHGF